MAASRPPSARLRSRVTTDGLDRATHRAFLRATGLDDAAIARPFIGVVTTAGEVTPCSMTLAPQAAAAKAGVAEAGGTPREFTTISVSDGLAQNHQGMKFSLVSREVIAYDGLVGFGGCDKTLPGIMMAMVRCNVPSVFMYGGAALPGSWRGREVTVLDAYEGIGAVLAGRMSEAELDELERACLPTVGSCAGQFTANTMAMVSEALGLALPGSAMIPGVHGDRLALARRAGAAAMRILEAGGPLPRDILTRESLENACAVVAATGGSTNAGLHLPAIAHEAGIRFTLDDAAAVFARTPVIADLKPGGRFNARDVHRIGGAGAVLKALLEGGFLHGDCPTVARTTLAASLDTAPAPDGEVVRATAEPLLATGGVVVLKGNLCPDGALLKVAGLRKPVHEGPALVFESEEACVEVVRSRAYAPGSVSSSATRGRAAVPACARCSGSPR